MDRMRASHAPPAAAWKGEAASGRRRQALVVALVPLLIALPALAWTWSHRSAPTPGLSARQALDRAEALCRTLAPDAGLLRLTAEPIEANREGQPVRTWYVDGVDQADRTIVHQIWDRDTGDLWKCSRLVEPRPAGAHSAVLVRAQAVRSAARALQALGLARQASQWRVAGALEGTRYAWWVPFQANDRKVFVSVDACTGDPISVEIVPGSPRAAPVPLSTLRSSRPGGTIPEENTQ